MLTTFDECRSCSVNAMVDRTTCANDTNADQQVQGGQQTNRYQFYPDLSEHRISTCDYEMVLDNANITNGTVQAEDMLMNNSGEYINELITNGLAVPLRYRHVSSAMCLCQYVQHKVYRISV